MMTHKISGWFLVALMSSHLLVSTFAYPQQQGQLVSQNNRKYAEKPNALKKVALDDIDDDLQTNQLSDGPFSWSNMLGMVMQMFFNGAGNQIQSAPSKSDDLDNSVAPVSPWANIITVGLKIITALLGGNQGDGIDKVDNGNSPMQGVIAAVISSMFGQKDPQEVNTMAKQAGEFINIVMNLMDALKTSFSHRSLAARSLGKRDSMSDASVASITMLKGYMKTYNSADEKCMQKYICQANEECSQDIGGSSIFCQLGTYATSFVLERQTGKSFEHFNQAGHNGRKGLNCKQIYLECNEV